MGVGNAAYGLTDFFKQDPSVLTSIDAAIIFVTENDLRSVNDPDDDRLARTYFDRSLVFVADDHPAFDPERKKPKRRHGKVRRSDKTRLQEMLYSHQEEVFALLELKTAAWREEQSLKEGSGPMSVGLDSGIKSVAMGGTKDRQEFEARALDVDTDMDAGAYM